MDSSRISSRTSKYATLRTQATTSTTTFTRTMSVIAKDNSQSSSKMTEDSRLPPRPALWTQISKTKPKTSQIKLWVSTVCKFSPLSSLDLEISRYIELLLNSICKINSKSSSLLNWATWLLKKGTRLHNCTKICTKWYTQMEIINSLSLSKTQTSNFIKDMLRITCKTFLTKETKTTLELISQFLTILHSSKMLTKRCSKTVRPTTTRSSISVIKTIITVLLSGHSSTFPLPNSKI